MITVLMRAPYIDRPLSHCFEWLTAHALIVQQIWFEEGGANNLFAQKMNFSGQTNKFINNASMSNHYDGYPLGFDDSYFYLSNPSFGLVPPYLIFKLLNIYPNPLGIQIFNMVLQFICAIFLYLIVCILTESEKDATFNLPAVAAAIVYLIAPTCLWFHSNTYYIEIFVQLPFVASVFFLLKYLNNDKSRYLYCLGASLFIAATTEWIGIFLASLICVYILVNAKKGVDYRLFFCVCLSTVFGVGLFILQNSLVVGFENFINHELRQFFYQSNTKGTLNNWNETSYYKIARNYLNGMYPIFILVLVYTVPALFKIKLSEYLGRFGKALLFLGMPCLMHHVLLSRFTTEHWFSILKSTFFIGLLLASFIYFAEFLFARKKIFYLLSLLFFIAVSPLVKDKYQLHVNEGGDPYFYKTLASKMAEIVEDDDVLFCLSKYEPRPQLIYYLRRNIKRVDSVEEAKEWLLNSKISSKKGVVFTDLNNPIIFNYLEIGKYVQFSL